MQTQYELFGKPEVNDNSHYTKKIQVPQYLPSEVEPKPFELVDKSRYTKLMASINTANISDEDKEFLKLAATRHLVFNYAKIADYYAHADKTVQELMEQSALVIIDVDDAIANGYVRLSSTMKKIIEGK